MSFLIIILASSIVGFAIFSIPISPRVNTAFSFIRAWIILFCLSDIGLPLLAADTPFGRPSLVGTEFESTEPFKISVWFMFSKSAFVDAVLRSSGLSDFYTQDLENMNHTEILKGSVDSNSVPTSEGRPKGVSAANKGKPMSDKQNKMIHALMKEKAVFTLGEIGIEKIANPTMEDASMIIKKLMDYKIEDKTIQIDKSDLPD